jgi:hypothetical protein
MQNQTINPIEFKLVLSRYPVWQIRIGSMNLMRTYERPNGLNGPKCHSWCFPQVVPNSIIAPHFIPYPLFKTLPFKIYSKTEGNTQIILYIECPWCEFILVMGQLKRPTHHTNKIKTTYTPITFDKPPQLINVTNNPLNST